MHKNPILLCKIWFSSNIFQYRLIVGSLLLFVSIIIYSQTKITKESIKNPVKTIIASNHSIPDPLKPDYVTDSLKEWEKSFHSFKFKVYKEGEHSLPYRFHQPEKLERGKRYPLVLFMHGAGERGLDNRRQLYRLAGVKFWEKYPCYVLSPQCPPKNNSIPYSEYVWVDTEFGDSVHSMKIFPTWSMKLAMDLLDKVIKSNKIDRSRIYVTGLSMGGFATWELIQRMPDKFAAAVPVCGGGDLEYAPKLSLIPLWVFHGDADKRVPVQRSRNMVEAITKKGGHPNYTEFPRVGHDSWTLTYKNSEMWDWMFTQSKKLNVKSNQK